MVKIKVKKLIIAGILLALLFMSLGLFLSYKAKPTPINVNLSSHEAYSMLQTGEDVVLVDVREKAERDIERIDDFGWVPYSHLKADHPEDWAELDGVVKAHNRAIIYCAIGKRSFNIVLRLREKGYSNVYNLAGGITEWKQKYPVIKAKEIEPEEQKIINITQYLKIEDFYTDKKVYYSNEIMTLTLKINSSSRIENVRIRTYGILDKWGSYRLNIEQKTNIASGTNMLDFSYRTPSCYGCVGINPGIYELTSLITYGEISVNKTTDIE
ncbi:rhodanese-like domain-containing protein, partial [Patescibacteria group bacterium]|nr:rhodanese-like domain-containing protein [Patescibacteria group bacterium]